MWFNLILDPNTTWVLMGSILIGLTAGVLGSFALLRRRSLMGDALAHAALPGVAIAFMITGSKHIGFMMLGAAVAGLLGTICISAITRYSKIKEDSAMGIVLSVFFGIGITLLTIIQRTPRGNQSGLDKFLFGQAASLVGTDVQVMMGIAIVLCLVVFVLFKELKLLSFDPLFGAGLGFPMGALDMVLNLMLVLAVVVGLQAVGVILMAALLITPAISARYWTDRLSTMVVLAGFFGALSGVMGTLLSLVGPRMSTGPLIVLSATSIFLVSLFLAPRRGLVAKALRQMRSRRQVARATVLRSIYELAEAEANASSGFTADELHRRKGLVVKDFREILTNLAQEGLLRSVGDRWALTAVGIVTAHRLVREQRLWEVFLMHESELDGRDSPIDRDQEDSAHFPERVRSELERLLVVHGLEPRLKGGA